METIVWVYVTSSATGTVHLILEEGQVEARPRTLCGQQVGWDTWHSGDETVSGFTATCGTCRVRTVKR